MNNRLMYYLGLCFFAVLLLFPRTDVQAEENKGSATFIYGDREVTVAGLKRAWGFTPLIKYDGKTILFNTGGKEEILKHNFQVLGIEPKDLDAVVISHEHWEMYLLREKNPAWEANLRSVSRFVQFTPSIYFQNLRSGRRRGGPHGIDEVHIILKTDRGLVIFQGCGHPQILHIVKKSKSYTGVVSPIPELTKCTWWQAELGCCVQGPTFILRIQVKMYPRPRRTITPMNTTIN
jgi:7,8-dihydropterin-6-yl-methyl-4-(beta-D-ribofuranosyl)aminobenzene 5'-phosphate synthase